MPVSRPNPARFAPPAVDTVRSVASSTAPATDDRSGIGPTAGSGTFGAADWSLFLVVSLIWGASFLLIDIGLDALAPELVTLLRVGLGAITLAVLPSPPARFAGRDRGRLIALSLVWVAIPFTLFPLAQQYINSATTGLLNGGTPIFTAIVAVAVYRNRPTPAILAGLVLGFAGVTLISVPSIGEGSSEAAGVVMVLAATVCYGLAFNLSTPLISTYGSLAVMRGMLVLATIWTAPLGLWGLRDSSFEIGPVTAVVALGMIGTGIAYLVMATLVGRVGPARASFITYLIPVVSLVLGVVFRDDRVPGLALIGIVLVIAGAVLAGRSRG